MGQLYFFSYLLFVKLIFLNLFIAIILQGFDETNAKQSGLINPQRLEHFRDKWSLFDQDGTSFIPCRHLPDLLFALGGELGWNSSYKDNPHK